MTIVVFGSDEAMLRRTLASTLRQSRPPDDLRVLVSGSEPGSTLVTAVEEARRHSGATELSLTVRPDNLGFAGGHNYLAHQAFRDGADWVTLLNPDLDLDAGALEAFWASVEQYGHDFAIHGPQLVSGPDDGLIDSAGIVWTRDGRHFDAAQGSPAGALGERVMEADGVSGAVLTVSRATHARLVVDGGEFLDDLFLAYREDAELGVRVRLMGGRCLVHPARGFRHERGARNGERSSPLQRCLGVQNRFLLKSRLGPRRPGNRVSSWARDLLVVLAVVSRERSSLPGLRRAWAVRRFERAKGRAVWSPRS